MAKAPEISPGTVSKILWHFTGGPIWNRTTQQQGTAPKAAAKAYANLKSILRSRELRLGQYKESVSVVLPLRRRWDPKQTRVVTERNVAVQITSAAVCCLSDIPAPHLRYHAYRYGKFAIGFHRDAVLKHGFNPVFYTLNDTHVLQSTYEGFSALRFVDPGGIAQAAGEIESALCDLDADLDLSSKLSGIELEADLIGEAIDSARRSLENLVAFANSFDRSEFTTVYCEREWRALATYEFSFDDVAMIVLPKSVSNRKYFSPFATRVAPRIPLPRRIPIVPWDDLVEH